MGTPFRILLGAAVVMYVLHRPAAAQSAEGEALFRDGRKLIKDGKLAEGCAKIAASERIETSTGTLLNLGDCREKLGQLASSWAAFAKAAATAKKDGDTKREGEARRRAKLLEPKLGKLTIKVATRVDGLEIRRDDDVVDAALWNNEAPVDAGSYKLTASAPGYKAWSAGVVVKDGTKTAVEVPALEREPQTPQTSGPPQDDKGSPPVDDEPVVVAKPGTFTTLRKVSIGVGVVGLVGVGLGVTFGLKARDLEDQANAICPAAACSDPNAVAINEDAQTHATRANIALIGGGVAVAGAVVLWFVGAPKATTESLSLAPAAHGTGLAVVGRF
ncbi:MAG TPA: hypothetical protein VL326_02080 [Kofleriaceae bacterium]|nr:hypothetical protein [Kofleriaceae bacterium]